MKKYGYLFGGIILLAVVLMIAIPRIKNSQSEKVASSVNTKEEEKVEEVVETNMPQDINTVISDYAGKLLVLKESEIDQADIETFKTYAEDVFYAEILEVAKAYYSNTDNRELQLVFINLKNIYNSAFSSEERAEELEKLYDLNEEILNEKMGSADQTKINELDKQIKEILGMNET